MRNTLRIRIEQIGIDYSLPLAWLTYFPFIGWLYPFVAMKDDAFAMNHGKRAFVMAVFFTALPVTLTFASAFVPISYRIASLVFAILVYLSHALYFGLCVWGFTHLKRGSEWDFPPVNRFADKVPV
ncbi:MAG: hypothetical protein JW838_12575 [Spirochaetes bacterium]|nr:hypothetical protein [Spirochaetota bacterium]